jgi:hypothetical protein
MCAKRKEERGKKILYPRPFLFALTQYQNAKKTRKRIVNDRMKKLL